MLFYKSLNLIKKSHTFDIGPNSLAKMGYYSSLYKIKDPYFLDIFINNYELYKEKYSSRQSFALLVMSLKFNLDKNIIYFFMNEYKKFNKIENYIYSIIIRFF